MARTDKKTIAAGSPNNLGWRELIQAPGEIHENQIPTGKVLAVLGHFSDLMCVILSHHPELNT